jgi:polyhydroxyalkanoate synthesis regulator phasin
MDVNKRFEEVSARMTELRARADAASREVEESWKQGIENFKSDMQFTRSSIDEITDETERNIELSIERGIDRIIEADEKLEAKRSENLDAARSRVEKLQDKINSLGQAHAKADQEELILNLLDYADECQETAVHMAEEAARAYIAAAKEIALYDEKYGVK